MIQEPLEPSPLASLEGKKPLKWLSENIYSILSFIGNAIREKVLVKLLYSQIDYFLTMQTVSST